MKLSIITPEKTLFSAEAEMVVVPGVEGDFGVLAGHMPFLSLIRPGVITVDAADGTQRKIAVVDGFAEASPEGCTILAETAIDCAGITMADVQGKLEEAKRELAAADTDDGRKAAGKKLALAEALIPAVA